MGSTKWQIDACLQARKEAEREKARADKEAQKEQLRIAKDAEKERLRQTPHLFAAAYKSYH